MSILFDRTLYRIRRERTSATFPAHDFLHRIAEDCVLERLDVIDRTFPHTLIIGAASDCIASHPRLHHCVHADMAGGRLPHDAPRGIVMDEEWLPFQEASLDAIISILMLHHVNDVAGALIQMQRALKPDGLLMVVTVGARSLMELRSSLADAEIAVHGGVSPRISPFMEVRDGGALLQRAGFALPVADSEMLNLSYSDIWALCRELKGAGEGNVLHERMRGATARAVFSQAQAAYCLQQSDAERRLRVSAELLFLTGWKPHPSQQQPSKRGSGKVNLREIF
jgi:NADH dehydrogenase [ubiquinone] 1 alpha subcomplex assembly factor 5